MMIGSLSGPKKTSGDISAMTSDSKLSSSQDLRKKEPLIRG